ncbi:MAG: hypothetical protein Q9M91_07735 [Candidatus Dojkabacteria bacterium]|nr:hypothetical protein [Candidatus Dojkabacteria bacterium]
MLTYTLILLFGTLLALWSPWLRWNISIADLLGAEKPESIAGLQVFSLAGELNIYVDDEFQGTVTTDNSPYFINNITPGERRIRVERKSDTNGAYWNFNRLISFEEGNDVVISYNIGPSEEFSTGNFIYTTKSSEDEKNRAKLNFKLNVEDSIISIDNITKVVDGYTVSEYVNLDKQYSVKVSKSGYEDLEFTLLPSESELRSELEGHDLNVEVNLMLQPVLVE